MVIGRPVIFLVLSILFFLTGLLYSISFVYGTLLGVLLLFLNGYDSFREKSFSYDYLALLALIVAFITGEFTAGTVVAIMASTGGVLEDFAKKKARSSLDKLLSNIPSSVTVITALGEKQVSLKDVSVHDTVIVRNHQIIPFDSKLISEIAIINEANITGESVEIEYTKNCTIKSGSVNHGDTILVSVNKSFNDSTYKKILDLVSVGEKLNTPLLTNAGRLNIVFTLFTIVLSAAVYAFTGDLVRVLAILVLATPCPLLIAPHVAYISAMSLLAKHNIIVKSPSSLEYVSKTNTLVFDKTGTLTMGDIDVSSVISYDANRDQNELLKIVASIEVHSIHPIAKSIIKYANSNGITFYPASSVMESLGEGITGIVGGFTYKIIRDFHHNSEGISILVYRIDGDSHVIIGKIIMQDELKKDAMNIVNKLSEIVEGIIIATGDTMEHVKQQLPKFPGYILASCKPEQKYKLMQKLRKEHRVVCMVGDGLNDAPALSLANSSVVFAHQIEGEQAIVSDIVVVNEDLGSVLTIFEVAKNSIKVAKNAMYIGIGSATLFMLVASFGFIKPVIGAIIQELIDVTVILYALIFSIILNNRIKTK